MSDNQIHAVPASTIQSSQPKSTILKKPNAKAKKGLGAKKTGGLGAQKVKKIDFNELEKDAVESDKARSSRLSVSSSGSARDQEEKLSETSKRLAYKDIENIKKQNDKTMSNMDGRKKEQAQRLGMGMGRVDGVSHSMAMMTIDQQGPQEYRSRRNDNDIFYDARSSSRWMSNDDESDEDVDSWSRRDFSYGGSQSGGSKTRKTKPERPPTYTISPIEDTHKNTSSVIISGSASKYDESSRPRKNQSVSSNGNMEKYANAKAISSTMLFGEGSSSEQQVQRRMRNLEGRTAISSEDFNEGSPRQQQSAAGHLPDLGNIKEGVRSVAGKLSSMASGIASTIQDRYGT